MRPLLTSLLVVSLFVLTGCSNKNQPSDSDISKMSTHFFNEQFTGLFTVTNMIKENGYKQNETHYVAEMNITARAERSFDEYARNLIKDPKLSALERMTSGMAIGLLKMTLPDFVAGDELKFKRDYLFIKTDKGWLLKKELGDEATH